MKDRIQSYNIFGKIFVILMIGFVISQSPKELMAQNQEMEEANVIMSDMNESIKEVNSNIEQVQGYYIQLRDCLSGAGETGSECQRYIDMLYNMEGGGIELQDEVMTVKELGNQIIKQFEDTRAFKMLQDASSAFSRVGGWIDNSANALEFAQKFNVENARSDPTAGLRIIGEAIGGAAGSLPYPMDEIFKGYAEAVTNITGKLNDLQRKIEESRQGSLGGSYSGYADAQVFFDANFANSSRLSIEFFDVTPEFPLLGGDVQVFINLGSLTSEYYVFKGDTKRGWIAPTIFKTIYDYFVALPASNRSDVTVAYRPELFVSQAKSNPGPEIEKAKEYYNSLRQLDRQFYMRQILEEMQLLDTANSLVQYGEDAFIGYWLLIAQKHTEIQRVVDVLNGYVYSEGKVMQDSDTGQEPAPGEPVTLTVDGGGTGQVTSDGDGNYFVYTRGDIGSDFTISAGQGEAAIEETGNFYQRGFSGFNLVLKKVEKTPVSISISPAEATLEVGESVQFTALAIFEDSTATNISGIAGIWNIGSNSFTATEAGDFPVSVTYKGLQAGASVTVEEEEEVIQCNEPSEILDEESGACICNREEGYDMNDKLGKCVSIDDALEEVTEDGEGELCDVDSFLASMGRLDELVASGNQMAASFRATLNKFMKEINDQNSNPCENAIIAAAYAGAQDQLAEYNLLVDEATSLSTDLILEGSLCPLEEIEFDINAILQKVSQLGQPKGQIEDGLAMMENQLLAQSCDLQEVEDQGDTIAERGDPEVIQAGGTGATESCGDGIDNDGDGLIDEDCEDTGNFNVIIVLYDSGSAADDIFGLSVSGQGNLGTTPEGGSRTYPLRLSPGSYVATVTVISAPDNTGTYTIRILEGDQEIASDTGGPAQGSVISVPFTIGGTPEASAETESILPRMMNFMRQIDQIEGRN